MVRWRLKGFRKPAVPLSTHEEAKVMKYSRQIENRIIMFMIKTNPLMKATVMYPKLKGPRALTVKQIVS